MLRRMLPAILLALASVAPAAEEAPSGFVPLFNGRDLTGWCGGSTFDPRALAAMRPGRRAAQIAQWTKTMKEHWSVQNGELVNDGQGDYASTEKDYGDFELLLEYKTVPKADSGIYLRGCPQVQIWDSTDTTKFVAGADKGSGGLWNNSPGAPGRDPLVKADKPFGQWNKVRVVIIGTRVSVWLNDQRVVDHAIMENYFDKTGKLPIPARGPIQLQTHGGEIRWRNILLREISADEASEYLRTKADAR